MKGNEFEHFLGNFSLSTLLAKASFAFLLLSMLFYWFQTTFNTDKKAFIGKVPALTMWLANITLAIMLFLRWVESGHFPLSNLYESLLFLSWSLTSIHLVLENVINSKNIVSPILNLGSITSPLALFTNAFATFSLPQEMQKVTVLVPALQSNWLIMHVSVMMASYAALLSGSLLAMAFLVVNFFDEYRVICAAEQAKEEAPLYGTCHLRHFQKRGWAGDAALEKDYLLRKSTPVAAVPSSRVISKQAPFVASQTYAVPSTKGSIKSKQNQRDMQVSQVENSTVTFPTREAISNQIRGLFGFTWFNRFQKLLKLTSFARYQNDYSFANSKKALDNVHTVRLSTLLATFASSAKQPPLGIRRQDWSINEVDSQNTLVGQPFSYPPKGGTGKPQKGLPLALLPSDANAHSKQTFIKQPYIESAEESLNLAQILDNLSYRSIGLGFALLTIGIFSGAVWANEAWGAYWNWDPKETWALITWLIFALYLHTRLSQGWVGKESAFVATFGFLVLWFCYLGVNLFGKGLHSYGWFPEN